MEGNSETELGGADIPDGRSDKFKRATVRSGAHKRDLLEMYYLCLDSQSVIFLYYLCLDSHSVKKMYYLCLDSQSVKKLPLSPVDLKSLL